jgi:hypothetical protein
MSGAIPPLTQNASIAWCLVKKHRDNYLYLLPYYNFDCSSNFNNNSENPR